MWPICQQPFEFVKNKGGELLELRAQVSGIIQTVKSRPDHTEKWLTVATPQQRRGPVDWHGRWGAPSPCVELPLLKLGVGHCRQVRAACLPPGLGQVPRRPGNTSQNQQPPCPGQHAWEDRGVRAPAPGSLRRQGTGGAHGLCPGEGSQRCTARGVVPKSASLMLEDTPL